MHINEIQLNLDILKKYITCKCEVAGSIRRGHEEPKDANILVETPMSWLRLQLNQFFVDFSKQVDFVGPPHKELFGEVLSFRFRHFPIHILCCRPDEWGSNLLYWTGSLRFTLALRTWAKDRLMLLNRHGLFFNGELIAAKTEEMIFYALESEYMTPEERD